MRILLTLILLVMAVITQARQIQVLTENGLPIAGAQVLVGFSENNPFPGNTATTNEQGLAQFPQGWQTPLPVTIRKQGFVLTRFLAIAPESLSLQIHKDDFVDLVEVSGETVDFKDIKRDGLVDFALVFPAMSRRQLMQFSATDLISPETDEIRIATERVQIPSNLTLPEQRENYVIPINFKKPNYRAYVKPDSSYNITAAHGRFPIKEVVDALRKGQTFLDVINFFAFRAVGQSEISVGKNKATQQNINVSQQILTTSFTFTAPHFSNDLALLTAALVERNGLFYPTDIKRLEASQEMNLTTSNSGQPTYVASLLMQKPKPNLEVKLFESNKRAYPLVTAFKMLSQMFYSGLSNENISLSEASLASSVTLAIQKMPISTAPVYISHTAAPIMTQNILSLDIPQAPDSIDPVATYVVFSEIETKNAGQYESERRFRLLEFFSQQWLNQIELPNMSDLIQPGKKYRWEVLYLGRDKSSPKGDYFLDEITHVSRNFSNL